MKVPPPLTQQSSARAEPASQCSTVPTASTLSSNFYVQGWVRAKLILNMYQGMEEKLVKWEEGKG